MIVFRRFALKLFLILMVGTTLAQNAELGGVSSKKDPGSAQSSFLSYLPFSNYACAIKKGLAVLGLGAYGSVEEVKANNSGVSRFVQDHVNNNPCFAKRASEFQIELLRLETELEDSYGTGFTYAHYSDQFGSGKYKDLKPGLVWDLAMRSAGGNSEAALMMIAICHAGDLPSFTVSEDEAKRHDVAWQQILQKKLNRLNRQLEQATTPEEKNFVREAIDDVTSEFERQKKQSGNQRSICLRSALSVFPKALGNEVDVPEALKEKISIVQNRPLETIEPKNYHMTTAMLFGCVYRQCGISPSTASWMQGRLGSSYRTLILCKDTDDNVAMKEFLEKKLRISYSDSEAAKKGVVRMIKNYADYCGDTKEKGSEKLCSILERYRYTEGEVRSQKIDRLIAEIDASILYQKWYLGGSVLSLPLCSDIRVGGPQNLLEKPKPGSDSNNNIRVFMRESHCKIPGWTSERCMAARRKLATWDVDIEWTKTQHQVGALFAANKCGNDGSMNDAKLCELPPLTSFDVPLNGSSGKKVESVR